MRTQPFPRVALRLAALLGLALLPACLPLPTVAPQADLPRPSRAFDLAQVRHEYVVTPGFNEPGTPDALDRVMTLRFRAPPAHVPQGTERTVLILSPGIFGGAASFDHLARQLVAALPGMEVWAVDRRANALEDRSALADALRRDDPDLAAEAYVGSDPTFTPIPDEDLAFMRGWGLEVHLQDLHVLVREANRDFDRVLLGGFSLSGALAGYYAAYRFPPGPDAIGRTAGQEFLDALVLLEGVPGRTGGFGRAAGLSIGPFEILPDAVRLRQGEGRPYAGIGQYHPSSLAERSALNLIAHLDPDGLAPEAAVPYPATNEAALGIRYSERYAVSTAFGATLGEAVNADVRGNLAAFLVSGPDGARNASIAGPAGEGPVGWARGDAPVDPRTLARSWSYARTDADEWYFPSRLAADLVAADVSLEDDDRFLPNREVSLPTLVVGAGRGLVSNERALAAYQSERLGYDLTTAVVPGYTHLDVLWADDNPVVAILERWLGSRFRVRDPG